MSNQEKQVRLDVLRERKNIMRSGVTLAQLKKAYRGLLSIIDDEQAEVTMCKQYEPMHIWSFANGLDKKATAYTCLKD
jgi:hypothetical protein